MRKAEFLKQGDKVAIISTARKICEADVLPAVEKLKEWGLIPVLGNNLFSEYNQYAGTDEQRTNDLQSMLDNSEIKAILCARGGYGTVRIIDKIDFEKFKENPKWIVGYSDVTVLHSHINRNFEIETLHATMPFNFPKDGSDNSSVKALREALLGDSLNYEVKPHLLNRKGVCKAEVVGGNLSILYSLLGTKSCIDTKNKILFLEDLDEYLYHIDRMMMALKRSGMLNNIAGLIVGGMSDMHDNTIHFGKTAEEIIYEHVAEYSFPVCFNFPAGHINENLPIFMGAQYTLEVVSSGTFFKINE